MKDFAYAVQRICQSLHYGNTDQIGRNAWNGFIEYIQNGVANFVNECNHRYQQNDPDINPQNTPNFLPEGVPEFVNTRNHNNSYDISIGIVTSSLQRDQIKNINARARPTRRRIRKQRGQGAVPRSQHQGAGLGAGAGEGQAGGGQLKPFSTFTQPL